MSASSITLLKLRKKEHEKADFYPYAGIFSGPNWISEAEQKAFLLFFLTLSFHSSHTTATAQTERLQ